MTRYALILLMILVTMPARAGDKPTAQSPANFDAITSNVEVYRCDNSAFADLPVLAARLGVKPNQPSQGGTMVLTMCDGRAYDFIAIINAVLDRMDKSTRH